MGVLIIREMVGTSPRSWSDAARQAVATAAQTVRNIRSVEVVKSTATVENGAITEYRVELKIINDDIFAHPVKAGEVHLGDRDLWAKVPEFQYEPPGLGWVLAHHATALALLFAWFAIAAWFAWRSAAQLRPL